MRRGPGGIIGILVILWLIVGAIACGQRGYFTNHTEGCGGVATIAVTILAGPLNYMGLNPKVAACNVPNAPQPSP